MGVAQIERIDDGREIEFCGIRFGSDGGDKVVAYGMPHEVFPETFLWGNGILRYRVLYYSVGRIP